MIRLRTNVSYTRAAPAAASAGGPTLVRGERLVAAGGWPRRGARWAKLLAVIIGSEGGAAASEAGGGQDTRQAKKRPDHDDVPFALYNDGATSGMVVDVRPGGTVG